MKKESKFILSIFILLISVITISSSIGKNKLQYRDYFTYKNEDEYNLFYSLANFDGVHYLKISQDGYKNTGSIQAFFPLYPILVKTLTLITRNYLASAIIISGLSFLASLFIFYKLLKLDYKEKTVREIILYLTFFSTSFYFLSVYTESLFLLLTISFFYFLRQKKYTLASLVGILTSATRITGIFLIPAFIYELYIYHKTKNKKKSNLFNLVKKYYIAFIPALGLLLYILYLKINFDDPLLFVHVQKDFGSGRDTSQFILLHQVFFRYIKMLLTVDPKNPIFFTTCLEFYSTLLFIGLLIFAFIKKIRLSYLIYAIPSLILPTLTGILSSMPRYVLVLFPSFIALSLIKNKFIKYSLAIINFILLPICTALFTQGYWIS